MNKYILTIIAGVASAAFVDLTAWQGSRKRNREARFDWFVAIPRWFLGGLTGLGVGAIPTQE